MLIRENVIGTADVSRHWTQASAKFSYAPNRPGVGPGEEKLAAELGGKIMGGSVSYDVILPSGEKLEVKELDKDGALRTGTEGAAAASRSVGIISKICDELNGMNLDILRDYTGDAYPDELDEFIRNDVPLIQKGEMTTSRALGSESKFGLLQALQFIHELMQAAGGEEHVVSLDDRQVPVDDVKFAKVVDVVEPGENEFNVEPISREIAKAKSRAFDDPEWFIDDVWAHAAVPSEVFPAADALAIVTPDGYRLIPKSKLDKVLVFTRISQGKPRFKVT